MVLQDRGEMKKKKRPKKKNVKKRKVGREGGQQVPLKEGAFRSGGGGKNGAKGLGGEKFN